MAYTIKGKYVASCSCNVICPCPVDGVPTDPNGKGECRGVAVFRTDSGNQDDTDLSGVNFALVNFFPSNISSGNWKLGVVVDESASEAQVAAVGKILSGADGGPFADFAPLVGEMLGTDRGKVSVSDDGGSINGTSFSFEPFKGPDGSDTTVSSAMFGFAPTYTIGKTAGKADVMGISFDADYGESADYEYSSETADVHARG